MTGPRQAIAVAAQARTLVEPVMLATKIGTHWAMW